MCIMRCSNPSSFPPSLSSTRLLQGEDLVISGAHLQFVATVTLGGEHLIVTSVNTQGTEMHLATSLVNPVDNRAIEFGPSHVRSPALSIVRPNVIGMDLSVVMAGMLVTVLGQNLDMITSVDCPAYLSIEMPASGWLTLRAAATVLRVTASCSLIAPYGIVLELPPLDIVPAATFSGV